MSTKEIPMINEQVNIPANWKFDKYPPINEKEKIGNDRNSYYGKGFRHKNKNKNLLLEFRRNDCTYKWILRLSKNTPKFYIIFECQYNKREEALQEAINLMRILN